MLIQAGFAIMVGSQSMLADSEAMGVDAMTYLFNLCAERIKNAPYSAQELRLPADVRDYKRTLKRLYLELIPPMISVTTLIAVTIVTMHDAMETLFGNEKHANGSKDGEMVGVMLFFSTLNLMLDVVNVTCFARADQAYVNVIQNQEVKDDFKKSIRSRRPSEDLSLMVSSAQTPYESGDIEVKELHAYGTIGTVDEVVGSEETLELVNLNMCSAWTVSCINLHFFGFVRSCCVVFSHFITSIYKTAVACLCRYHEKYSSLGGCCNSILV